MGSPQPLENFLNIGLPFLSSPRPLRIFSKYRLILFELLQPFRNFFEV